MREARGLITSGLDSRSLGVRIAPYPHTLLLMFYLFAGVDTSYLVSILIGASLEGITDPDHANQDITAELHLE